MILRELRKGKGLTQEAVANSLGIARSTYIAYEKHINEPNIAMIKKMASLFDVSIDTLLEYNLRNVIIINKYSPIKREVVSNILSGSDDMAYRVNAYMEVSRELSRDKVTS